MKSVPLGDLITSAHPRRAGHGKYPVLSMTMYDGLVDQAAKFKKRIASDDLSGYKLIARGQLVVGFPIDEGVLDFQTRYDAGIVSPAYGVWDLREPSLVDIHYLKLFLRSPHALAYYKAKLRGSTARRRSLPSEIFLALQVPLPPPSDQRRIAAILDHADDLRAKRRETLRLIDDLTESIFTDCFGDDLTRSHTPLHELAEVTSGITKGRKTTAQTAPVQFLAVSNVQAGHLNMDVVKEIEATAAEIQRYSLRDGDLVLTEGGDPDKLGRGTVWRGELPVCLHQNHIFRVRIRDGLHLHPDYLSAFIASPPVRSYFLKAAKQTTGIASINMTQLKALPVFVPTADRQRHYLDRLQAINQRRAGYSVAAKVQDELFASLQSRAFRGEL